MMGLFSLTSVNFVGALAGALAIGVSIPALAGVGSSGGGHAVVCTDSNGIELVQLLDLYEAAANGTDVRAPVDDLDREYAIYLNRLRLAAEDPRPVTDSEIDEFQRNLAEYFNFVPGGLLPDVDDFGSTVEVPDNCQIRQLAVYHDDVHRIDVDIDLWNKLDTLNQVALYAHETIYFMYRFAGDKSSIITRNLLPSFFSMERPTSQYEGIPDQAASCSAHSRTGQGSSMFYIYPDLANENSSILQFIRLFDRPTLSVVRTTIPIQISESDLVFDVNSSNQVVQKVVDPYANINQRFTFVPGPFEDLSIVIDYRFNRAFSISLVNPQVEVDNRHFVATCWFDEENS